MNRGMRNGQVTKRTSTKIYAQRLSGTSVQIGGCAFPRVFGYAQRKRSATSRSTTNSSRLHDRDKLLSAKTGAAHEGAVNIRHGHKGLCIIGLDAPAILYD